MIPGYVDREITALKEEFDKSGNLGFHHGFVEGGELALHFPDATLEEVAGLTEQAASGNPITESLRGSDEFFLGVVVSAYLTRKAYERGEV